MDAHIFKKEDGSFVVLECCIDHSAVVVIQQEMLGIILTTLFKARTTSKSQKSNVYPNHHLLNLEFFLFQSKADI